MEELEKCKLCPIQCQINRNKGELGKCKAGSKIQCVSKGNL